MTVAMVYGTVLSGNNNKSNWIAKKIDYELAGSAFFVLYWYICTNYDAMCCIKIDIGNNVHTVTNAYEQLYPIKII